MSKRWKVVNKQTGEPWMPDSSITQKQFLMLFDSGFPAVVTDYGWDGYHVLSLDPKQWKVVWKATYLRGQLDSIEKDKL